MYQVKIYEYVFLDLQPEIGLEKDYTKLFTDFINELHPEEDSSRRFIACMN